VSELKRGGWYLSPAGFVRRVLQAADESNVPFLASALTFDALLAAVPFVLLLLVGLTTLLQSLSGVQEVDPNFLFHGFLPPHSADEGDPFSMVEKLLGGIANNRGAISLYAIPTFIWFSTRLFAGIRTSLNSIYDVSVRPQRRRNFEGARCRDGPRHARAVSDQHDPHHRAGVPSIAWSGAAARVRLPALQCRPRRR
jgi:uncharacterized BrkB/YihY/UPF0761 family membrane protein